jgi:anti-sigma B factor antagonist
MINGVPVVTTPAEIDLTTAEQLRMALLRAAARRQTTVVVDMTRTRFCDSAGLTVLVRAHKRALAEGGELRLVVPADGAVARILGINRLDLVIPLFGSLEEALTAGPAAVTRPWRPRPSTGRRPGRQPGSPGRGA